MRVHTAIGRRLLGVIAMVLVACGGGGGESRSPSGNGDNPPTTCSPDCGDRICGDDGCGGSCGSCEDGQYCYEGICIANTCYPSCANRVCGDDGCGGICGICVDGEYCVDGACIPGACTPDCMGKECGFDGCNGVCGTCPETHYCTYGVCLPKGCSPNCDGKVCGADGCGGLCGQCTETEYCVEGACIPGTCIPDCTGKECGFDGCNGVCGTCQENEFCSSNMKCEPKGCQPQCSGKQCGDNGCGGVCGTCIAGTHCEKGLCVPDSCQPQCAGKQCGPDGCGGSCGTCPPGQTCTANGTCIVSDSVAGWTLMVYMDADNDLERFAIENDMIEMLSAGGGSNLNIVVLVDRIPGESEARVPGVGNFTDSRVLLIKNGQVSILDAWGEINMGDPATLRDFVAYAVKTFPAKRYMLDLWNHGGATQGGNWDETNFGDNLSIGEMVVGISEGLAAAGLSRLDIVGFDECLMGAYEVAAAMKPYANYMLASEEVEPGTGWDYRAFSVAASNPDVGPVDLGMAILNGFFAQCEANNQADSATLSLIDLSKIDNVTNKIWAFVSAIGSPMGTTTAQAVAKARAAADEYGKNPQSPSYMIDFIDLLDQMHLSGVQETAKTQLRSAIANAIVLNKAGPGHANARGLSVYFPPSPKFYGMTYDQIQSVDAWRTFLKAYYAVIASDHVPPKFTNSNNIADVTFHENSATITGQLAPGSVDDVTDVGFEFGLYDDASETVILLGDFPATVDWGGLVSFEWDYTAGVVIQGGTSAYAYFEVDVDDQNRLYLTIPVGYREVGAITSQPAFWMIAFDLNLGELVSSTFYAIEQGGLIGEITATQGSRLYLHYPIMTPNGIEWWEYSDYGFDALQSMDFEVHPLAQGMKVFVLLYACDAVGNCDSVYNIIQL